MSNIPWDDAQKETVSPTKHTGGGKIQWDHDPWHYRSEMGQTLKTFAADAVRTTSNMGNAAAIAETAANFATSSYGVPISGLVGLGTLLATGDLDTAGEYMARAQKFLVYEPVTEKGRQLTSAAMYPMEQLDKAGGYVGGKIENPNIAAAAHTAVTAAPVALAARSMGKNNKVQLTRRGPSVKSKSQIEIERGVYKGVRPPVTKKELYQQRVKYMKNADTAVREIINNKKNLQLTDKDGNVRTGLPKSLDEFNQAIDQTKRSIFNEYDSMAKKTNEAVYMDPIAAELSGVINNKVMQTASPETVKYAIERQKALLGKKFTATEAQEMSQIYNQTLDAFYKNPSMEMKGKAYVDSLIANNLKAALDASIEKASGPQYQALKRKYGALRMLETDVTKRAIVDARKNIKGLIDFTDIFSSHQLVYGMFSGQLPSVAAGATVKLLMQRMKFLNDPNRIVGKMFKQSDKYIQKAKKKPGVVPKAMLGIGVMEGQINKER